MQGFSFLPKHPTDEVLASIRVELGTFVLARNVRFWYTIGTT